MEDQKQRVLRAISVLYLIIPVFLFAWGWLRLPWLILTILIVGFFSIYAVWDIFRAIRVLRKESRHIQSRTPSLKTFMWIGAAFLLITIWLLLSGIGGFGFQNTDYQASNALLKELISQNWPLTVKINGNPIPIVYYVGYYLPAAVVGKLFGWISANVFIFIWSWIGISLSFVWFIRLGRIRMTHKPERILVLALLFCLVGGLDFIGFYTLRDNTFELKKHVEAWAIFFQYSSNTTLIYWVPQHTIAAWLVISMIVDSLFEMQNLKYVGMAFAASILWSPFGIIGSMPFLLLSFIIYLSPRNRDYLFNRTSLLLNGSSLWVGSVLLLYITSNQFKFPFGLILQLVNNRIRYIKYLVAFWSLEFGLLAFLILLFLVLGIHTYHRSDKGQSGSLREQWEVGLKTEFNIYPRAFYLFLLSLFVLTILPLFKMGINNDLVMRASIPSLFIFWTFAIKTITDSHVRGKLRLKLLHVILVMVLTLGLFPGIAEISRSVKKYQFGPPPVSSVLNFKDLSTRDIEQRTGIVDMNFFYQYIGR